MRTLTDATLYTVNGPRGAYYAVRNHDTGAVFTEPTESAAAAVANEQDLVIVDTITVSHSELLSIISSRLTDTALPGHRPEREPMTVSFDAPGAGAIGFDRPPVWREPEAPAHR